MKGGAIKNLTVSVLITTYNGERFIDDQMLSILRQTRSADQVVIFDDGSTDGTVARAQSFIDNQGLAGWSIKVNKENLGPAINVLSHLQTLKCDVVFLADQDDVWEADKIEVMASFMESNPDCSLAVSSSVLIDAEGSVDNSPGSLRALHRRSRVHRRNLIGTEPISFNDFLGYSSVPLHAMCVRGSVINKIAERPDFPQLSRSLGADWYIGIWSTVLGRCYLIADKLVRRRIHDANISLGSLRKVTVLSTTQERRLAMLRESREAHKALLSDSEFTYHASDEQKSAIERIVVFLDRRISFSTRPSFVGAVGLLSQFDRYLTSAGAFRGAARLWLADLMYAFNINWSTKKRA